MPARKRYDTGKFGDHPRLEEEAPALAVFEHVDAHHPDAEKPANRHGGIDDDLQQTVLPGPQQAAHLGPQRLGLISLFGVISEEPGQEQHTGHPGDDRENMQTPHDLEGHAGFPGQVLGQAFQPARQPGPKGAVPVRDRASTTASARVRMNGAATPTAGLRR